VKQDDGIADPGLEVTGDESIDDDGIALELHGSDDTGTIEIGEPHSQWWGIIQSA
jgi:hypothetical protein